LDFWDLTVLIFRRWKISLPLLLLAIAGTVFVALTAKPDYTMTSYVQLIPAKLAPADNANPTTASLRNPWNQLGLNTLGQAAIYATQDQGFLDQLKAAGHTNNFTLTMTYPNPIVTVEVVGTTQADARDTTMLIDDRLASAAATLQSSQNVTVNDMIASKRLDQGQNVVPSRSKQKRAIIAVAAAGLIVTAGGTVGLDAILRRRSRRRLEEAEAADDESTPEPASAKSGVNGKATNGHNGSSSGKVPVVGGIPFNSVDAERQVLPESVERTAIIIKRTSSVVKPPVPKQQRRSPAATYRSANAQSVNGEDSESDDKAEEHESAPVETANGDAKADSSDVRAVLQPKWVGGENGGKSK
jgi:hypothetical protein